MFWSFSFELLKKNDLSSNCMIFAKLAFSGRKCAFLKRFLCVFIYCSCLFEWLHPEIIYLVQAVNQTFWNEHRWAYLPCEYCVAWRSSNAGQMSPVAAPQYHYFPAFGVLISVSVTFRLATHPWRQNMTSLWHEGNLFVLSSYNHGSLYFVFPLVFET